MAKKAPVDKALEALDKASAEEFLSHTKIDRAPWGLFDLDRNTGGGIPMGRCTIIWGPSDSGKTTIGLESCKAILDYNRKRKVLYLDFEATLDLEYAQKVTGYRVRFAPTVAEIKKAWKLANVVVVPARTFEGGTKLADLLVGTGDVGGVIVDSIASMTPRVEMGEGADEDGRPILARKLGPWLRRFTHRASQHGTAVILLNQAKRKSYNHRGPTAPPWGAVGGDSQFFYSALNLFIKGYRKKDHSQTFTSIMVKRNKLSKHRGAYLTYEINGVDGFDRAKEAMDLAEHLCLIEKPDRAQKWQYKGYKYTTAEIKEMLSDESSALHSELWEQLEDAVE